MKDGSSRPIGYASRTLSPTEKKYSQLDKEALSIIFGVTKFQQYLFGRHFTLFTDHKPLIYSFHPHRSVPQMASACIQHWSLILGAYSYDIHYRPGKDHGNADSLSRLPLPDYPKQVPCSSWRCYPHIFSIFGLPQVIVLDNATVFTSAEFQKFADENGITHQKATPYGLAEKAVQTFKEMIKKLSGPLETRLSQFLFAYRTTHQALTGVSPAFLMFGRTLHTRLDLLFPNTTADQVRKSQARMMAKRENRQVSSFKPGDFVYCRNFPSNQPKWIPAEVQATTGPLSYQLTLPDGRSIRRHVDHVISHQAEYLPDTPSEDDIIIPPQAESKANPHERPHSSKVELSCFSSPFKSSEASPWSKVEALDLISHLLNIVELLFINPSA